MNMKRQMIAFILVMLLGLFAAVFTPVQAQAAQPTPAGNLPTPSDDQVNAVAKQMFCPVCENIPLDVCPTQACQEWRDLIRQKLADGWSSQQIKAYFAAQYGDRVLSEPPRQGLNWMVYIMPVVFFLVGIVILWNVLKKTRNKAVLQASAESSSPEPADTKQMDPYLAQLEEELRRHKE